MEPIIVHRDVTGVFPPLEPGHEARLTPCWSCLNAEINDNWDKFTVARNAESVLPVTWHLCACTSPTNWGKRCMPCHNGNKQMQVTVGAIYTRARTPAGSISQSSFHDIDHEDLEYIEQK
ncbi:hypothetical protein NM208_g16736 [Fusarium decemcellulare]|uniref:Uncharacterized protein n=1 Tax=Fusarium decemcellulare TaxID=57161 RepID=A0ACC1R9W0_9HYPO|nr:hypothetical protein NM208_g16736 [Fusarium decemcellulare]